MKNLKNYLNEGLLTRKVSTRTPIRYKPQTSYELQNIIIDLLNKGITDLNCIDVSDITNMCALFYRVRRNSTVTIKDIDISEWNVSKVTNMEGMFDGCKEFNADLSNWDVSNVINMYNMFYECENFNCDLSKWNVSKVQNMLGMFFNCTEFVSDLSKWDVSKVNCMTSMFEGCKKINSDLSKWNVSNVVQMDSMFDYCDTLIKNNKIPIWYKG